MLLLLYSYLKKCYKCNWGIQYLTHDENGEFNGEAAPLWKNASPGCFLAQSVMGFLMIIAVVIAYVVYINGLDDSCTIAYKPWIIGDLIVVFASAIGDVIMYNIKYASDERWFRLIFAILGQMGLLVGVGGLSFWFGLSVLLDLGEQCLHVEQVTDEAGEVTDEQVPISQENIFSDKIWQANFFIACAVMLIIVCKLFLILWLVKNFYGSTSKFVAFASKPAEKKFVD
ncbi:hypothetical protein pb186bvf_018959 [Paramecium bursaria]